MKKGFKTFLLWFFGTIILSTLLYFFITFLVNFSSNLSTTHSFNFKFDLEVFKGYLTDKRVIILSITGSIIIAISLLLGLFKTIIYNPAKNVQHIRKSEANMFGSAKIMNFKTMKEKFGTNKSKDHFYCYYGDKDERNIQTDSAGWLLYSSANKGKVQYLFSTKDDHMLTIGSSGKGKTQFFLMPNIILNGCNSKEQPTMIINDVKGELFNQTSEKLANNGYRVLNLNLRNETSSSRFNPFEIIWKYYQSYITILRFTLTKGDERKEVKVDLSKCPSSKAVVFNLFEVSFGETKNKIKLKFKSDIYGLGTFDYAEGTLKPEFGECEIFNENHLYQILQKTEDTEYVKLCSLEIFKESVFLDRTTTEILAISSTIIPEGGGENTTWNTGSRGIIEGCLWAMLEDSLDPKLGMKADKFILSNLGNIVNGSPSEMIAWLKARDTKLSSAAKSAAMILDNDSEKTVSSYISNTQTQLKPYLTRGIEYMTASSDFILNDIVDSEQPVALYITIPDENSTKYPIAVLLIKQIYNYMIYSASINGDKLKRKAFFYLDEFAQMPKIEEFSQWINAARSRRIYFNIIIQSIEQLYGKYKHEGGESIMAGCNIQTYLGANDNKTIEDFSNKLGKETVVTKSSSGSAQTFKKEELNANYSLQGRDIVQKNELMAVKKGIAFIKFSDEDPIKTNFTPYYEKTLRKSGCFYTGSAKAEMIERIFNPRDLLHDIKRVADVHTETEKAKAFANIYNSRSGATGSKERGSYGNIYGKRNLEQREYYSHQEFVEKQVNSFLNQDDDIKEEVAKQKNISKQKEETVVKPKMTQKTGVDDIKINKEIPLQPIIWDMLENNPKTSSEIYKMKQSKLGK